MKKAVIGGYITLTAGELATICALRKAKLLSFAALRVYLACHEIKAKRCQAKKQIRYTVAEIVKLLKSGLGEGGVRKALKELEVLQLLTFSEREISFSRRVAPEAEEIVSELGTSPSRPVPIPRRLLRALARHTKPSEVIAALAHCIRCLFKKGKKITARGFVRASWISRLFGVAERAVYAARKWLTGLKFIRRIPVHQLVMNKWGACFEINLGEKAGLIKSKSAGLITISTNTSTYTNHINNKPLKGAFSGVYKNKIPDLRSIQHEDLRRTSKVLELYDQATRAGWLKKSIANELNFVSAAVRATHVAGNSAKIFVGLVKKQLWHHITVEQEHRAATALNKWRRGQGSKLEKRLRTPKVAKEGGGVAPPPPRLHTTSSDELNAGYPFSEDVHKRPPSDAQGSAIALAGGKGGSVSASLNNQSLEDKLVALVQSCSAF